MCAYCLCIQLSYLDSALLNNLSANKYGGLAISPQVLMLQCFFIDPLTTSGECSHGDVRLVNGANVLEGRVELCINNAWGTVCTDFISEDDVEVICRQIGQLPPGTLKVLFM